MKYIVILITIFSIHSCTYNKCKDAKQLQDFECIHGNDTVYYNGNDSALTIKGIKENNNHFWIFQRNGT